MTMIRLTFRRKLLGLVAITTIGFAILIGASAFLAARVDTQMDAIQRTHLPRVELEPQLDAQLDRMQRAFEDAVGSRDIEALDAVRDVKAKLLAILDGAGAAIDGTQSAQLREAIEAYYAAADDVSRRLIRGEMGEPITDAIVTMQAKLLDARGHIKRTRADRAGLATAFTNVSSAERTAGTTRLAISIGCLALVLTLSLVLSRRMIRSLDETTEGFERFGGGAFDIPIPIRTDDELADLARNANAMAARLDALAKERDRIEAALEGANRELEAFSYSVAHDLRAPLRGINGFSRALLEDYGAKLDDDGRDQLERICAGAERMGLLIDALLSLSRVQRAQISFERVDLTRAAERTFEQLRILHADRKVDAIVDPGMIADGDPTLIRAVLENLVGNAWKFTAKTTVLARIRVGSKILDGERVYFVEDNGAGFDMAYASKLFAPFQRLHAVTDFQGTGIGLATVQRILRRHEGRIWAESEPGKGATFSFTLPDHD